MTNAPPAEVGKLLGGRWRLVSPLGGGGQARTFIARDEKSPGVGERLVVVKALRLGDAGWKKFDLFEREGRVLATLDHPGIPRYLERIDAEAGMFYLVMERAPGDTLRDLAARRRFTEAELHDILGRILDILVYLHGREPPVVHRDIKPGNVLRDAAGAVSLVDFGGVRAAGEDGGSTVVGTYGYMAPEQLHGEATPRTDLYGAAATIVALAGGVEPEKVPRRGLKMDLARHLPNMARGLRALLDRMVDPDPERRPATAAEARALLAEQRPSTALAERAPEPEPPAPPDGDWATELDELRVPRPVRGLLRLLFGLIGIAGHLSLSLVSVVILPLVFMLARAFTGARGDARLREAERRTQAALRETRRGFRALTQRAFSRRPPQLPRAPDVPRLPRRRR